MGTDYTVPKPGDLCVLRIDGMFNIHQSRVGLANFIDWPEIARSLAARSSLGQGGTALPSRVIDSFTRLQNSFVASGLQVVVTRVMYRTRAVFAWPLRVYP
jgi:hypothetical protein